MTTLAATDARVTYPARRRAPAATAVDGVSLRVGDGEIVALVGESGCGKTSLARALLGLQRLDSGSITLDERPIELADRAALRTLRRQVQLIFQDPMGALNPRRTVFDAVAEGPRIQRMRGDLGERVLGALTRAGLRPAERFAARYPHELSGGQRQRVLIAGALAVEPRLLIADEPVSSLDASIRGEILEVLLDLARTDRMGLIVVTHDLGLAWNIADRVAGMYLGRIVEHGPAVQVRTAPRPPYTAALISVLPGAAGPPQVLRGAADPTSIPAGCRFQPRCPLVADGTAAALGIEQRCRTVDPDLAGSLGPEHTVACHAVECDTVGRPTGAAAD